MNYRGAVGNAREYRGIEEGEEAERELGEELVVVGEGEGEGEILVRRRSRRLLCAGLARKGAAA